MNSLAPKLDTQSQMPNTAIGSKPSFFTALAGGYSTGRLRRSTLVALRWAAIAGQTFALLLIWFGFGFPFPFIACACIIAASIAVNTVIHIIAPLDRRVSDGEALFQLGFDALQLAGLLFLTGGMDNPFILLFIAPVVTSATTLRKTVLFALILLTAILSLALLSHSQALPWYPGESFTLPMVFKFGLWTALMTGMAFTSVYAWRASLESRRMSDALAATEAVLAHEQKLAALGGLAAAAAHELGTPLATIQVTAKEMARELPANTPLGEDARLMHSQAERCRDILQQLGQRGDEGDAIHDVFTLEGLLDEVIEPFLVFDTDINIDINPPEGQEARPPQLRRQAELLYGLTNFVENASVFAKHQVNIIGHWDADYMYVEILDDGPGFDPAVRSRLGEPYVTSRPERTSADISGAGGLGLGFFIAKTLLERTGAIVNFGNRKNTSGAYVRAKWSRVRVETPQI